MKTVQIVYIASSLWLLRFLPRQEMQDLPVFNNIFLCTVFLLSTRHQAEEQLVV